MDGVRAIAGVTQLNPSISVLALGTKADLRTQKNRSESELTNLALLTREPEWACPTSSPDDNCPSPEVSIDPRTLGRSQKLSPLSWSRGSRTVHHVSSNRSDFPATGECCFPTSIRGRRRTGGLAGRRLTPATTFTRTACGSRGSGRSPGRTGLPRRPTARIDAYHCVPVGVAGPARCTRSVPGPSALKPTAPGRRVEARGQSASRRTRSTTPGTRARGFAARHPCAATH